MSSPERGKRVGVLIVEDEMIVLEDLRLRLKNMGYDIRATATTGQDAVRLADDLRPDVVVMDISLRGGMDGLAAASVISSTTGIPVVFVTGLGDPETLQRAKESSGFSFVLKPVDDRELDYVIEMALHRHNPSSRGEPPVSGPAAT